MQLSPPSLLPASRATCLIHVPIVIAEGPKSFDSDAAVRPDRANATICPLNFGVYRTVLSAIVTSICYNGEVSTRPDQLQYAVLLVLLAACDSSPPTSDTLKANTAEARQQAEQRDAFAEFDLGVMYSRGMVVTKNDAEAVKAAPTRWGQTLNPSAIEQGGDVGHLCKRIVRMHVLAPTDLKTILHSKRANIYFLEHCRVLVNGGRVEYVTEQGKKSLYWNIPIANTTSVLLGTGTSVTQAAMRELAKAGVLLGFCGGGGTPLFSAPERELEVEWIQPQSEYRPTEYLQHWVRFWFDDAHRLAAAKSMQKLRLARVAKQWSGARRLSNQGFKIESRALESMIDNSLSRITSALDTTALLTEEAKLTKQLYRLACSATNFGEFTRAKRGEPGGLANQFLDYGNYLAYGLAASATWVLGLPHGLAVLHGKTRRGGLVFDAADLIKDATVLPQAFISANRGDSEQEFRQACIDAFAHNEDLDFMFDTLKEIAVQQGLAAKDGSVGP